jgi:hypothetical protein
MAIDLEQLQADVQTVNDKSSACLLAIKDFRQGKVADQDYTTTQRTAIRAKFDADIRLAKVALDSLVDQLDANPEA